MEEDKLYREEVLAFRHRVQYEDQLLNSQTTIVLTLNGLMAVAASLSLPTRARVTIAMIIILINALWIVCALDAQHFIRKLTLKIKGSDYIPVDEAFRYVVQRGRIRIGTTRFMCIVVPCLLTAGWVLGLLFAASSLICK